MRTWSIIAISLIAGAVIGVSLLTLATGESLNTTKSHDVIAAFALMAVSMGVTYMCVHWRLRDAQARLDEIVTQRNMSGEGYVAEKLRADRAEVQLKQSRSDARAALDAYEQLENDSGEYIELEGRYNELKQAYALLEQQHGGSLTELIQAAKDMPFIPPEATLDRHTHRMAVDSAPE
ncbi:MAG: hypothetical protein K8R90_05335 [Candidatus Cloacimonetes bacterium]|nr:hypothetical protein [Candidatus Cloacimonadota bacterium]